LVRIDKRKAISHDGWHRRQHPREGRYNVWAGPAAGRCQQRHEPAAAGGATDFSMQLLTMMVFDGEIDWDKQD
jgi:hypothetical protein